MLLYVYMYQTGLRGDIFSLEFKSPSAAAAAAAAGSCTICGPRCVFKVIIWHVIALKAEHKVC